MKPLWRISRTAVAVTALVTLFAQSGLKAQAKVEDVPAEAANERDDANEEAEKHFGKMEEVLKGFLAATTVDEMSKFVRHRKRVGPLMKDYYRKNKFEPIVYKKIAEFHLAALENQPYIVLRVVDDNDASHSILLEDEEDGMLVDWETFVCYQPIDPKAFVKKKSTEPASFRAYVKRDNFYAYEFNDEKSYQCYRLKFKNTDIILYGFVKRGTKLDGKLGEIFTLDSIAQQPLILKMRFLEGAKSGQFVQIDSLESQTWVYVKPPKESPDQ